MELVPTLNNELQAINACLQLVLATTDFQMTSFRWYLCGAVMKSKVESEKESLIIFFRRMDSWSSSPKSAGKKPPHQPTASPMKNWQKGTTAITHCRTKAPWTQLHAIPQLPLLEPFALPLRSSRNVVLLISWPSIPTRYANGIDAILHYNSDGIDL